MFFLGLKTKLLLVTTLLMLGLGGYLAFNSEHQLNQLFYTIREDAMVSKKNKLIALLSQSAEKMSQLADFVSNNAAFDVEEFQHLIDSEWESLQLVWGVESLALLHTKGSVLKSWGYGERSLLEQRRALNSQQPEHSIVCAQQCRLRSMIPILMRDANIYHLWIETSLEETFRSFRDITASDVAIVTDQSFQDEVKDPVLMLWNQHLIATTNTAEQLSWLRAFAMENSLESLISANYLFTHAGLSAEVGALTAHKYPQVGDATLLVISDFSNIETFIGRSNDTIFVNTLLATGAGMVVLVLLVWRPVDRLRLTTKLMPLLTKGEFQSVRQQLLAQAQGRLVRDEIDVLIEAESQVAGQLQAMNETISADRDSLHRLAMYDSLTGMPNRNMLMHELEIAVSNNAPANTRFVLALLDIDNFKSINDLYGHQFGDELLKVVSLRLRNAFGEEDLIAHLSGDSFALLIRSHKETLSPAEVADRVSLAFEQRFKIHSVALSVSASVGVIQYPRDAQSTETLLQGVDLAMYRAKENGRNCYAVYQPDMSLAIKKKLRLEEELQLALEREEFRLLLQPQVELGRQEVIAAEVLVRWQHPNRGELTPYHFIGVMEETGLIDRLDDWVLEQAGKELKALEDKGLPQVSLAVNLSAQKFNSPGLVEQVSDLLDRCQVDPKRLELEITESMAMKDVTASARTLHQLRRLGVRLAIDDFGTGYSSLNYLKALNVDVLKIDRSFVKGLPADTDDAAIATAIIAMAHKLNLAVIAEGIETEAQCVYLREQGCELGQGYFFGRPMPIDDFISLQHTAGETENYVI